MNLCLAQDTYYIEHVYIKFANVKELERSKTRGYALHIMRSPWAIATAKAVGLPRYKIRTQWLQKDFYNDEKLKILFARYFLTNRILVIVMHC